MRCQVSGTFEHYLFLRTLRLVASDQVVVFSFLIPPRLSHQVYRARARFEHDAKRSPARTGRAVKRGALVPWRVSLDAPSG